MEKFPLLIAGATTNDGEIEVTAPYDNSLIATCVAADATAIELALENADKIFKDRDAWLSPAKRIEILTRAMEIISSRADELALGAAREGGKPLMDSKVEVARAIDSLQICIETLRTDSGREIPMNLNAASANRLAFTRKEPIGVVVAISAFNHPLNLIAHQVGPAVATGCPVIVKPAGDTPLSCLRFVQILYEAGLPKEYCQVVIVKDVKLATKLVVDPRVAFLSFIGSANVGWMLRSKVSPGTRCALEHGGVAPVIVAEDANLEEALPLLIKAGLYHAGQVCVSVQRIYAHKSIAKKLADMLAESAAKQKVGDPTLPETEVGPLIRNGEVDRVEKWVNETLAKGGECLTGGKRISDSCYECTVIYDPPDDSILSKSEVFGPVICVYPYSDMDEAITRANSLPFAFQAAIFTSDINLAMRGYSRLNASAVMINDHTAFRVDWMPFAGLKHSGLAVGGIPYTMHDMQIDKMMVIKSDEL